MNVVLVGLLLPCLDVFTMVDVPTKTQCIADIWLVGLAIATKLLRLYRIFNGIQTQIKGTGIPILIEAVLSTHCRTTTSAPDFNEAKVVGLCVYNQLVIVTVALPLLTTGVGSVAISVLFAVKQAAILIVVFATVAAVHGTKIYALIVDKDLPKHAMRQIDSESQRPVPGAAKPTAASAAGDQHDDQTIAPRLTKQQRVIPLYGKHDIHVDTELGAAHGLHVTRKGQERGSRRTAQLFFSGPQLFLRDIRQLGMESDGRDDRILHIYTGKTMTLMYGRRSTVVNEGRSSSAAGGLWSMSANGDGQTRTITAAATNHGSSGEVDNHVSSVTSALSSSGNPILTPTNTRIQ
ncbi:hypothetical protein BC831DRAFT_489144 [Entophlyctis helioformis]|nr:hypothetical protein BC831DRAFT_489144 [Entophlyctis helioformis]